MRGHVDIRKRGSEIASMNVFPNLHVKSKILIKFTCFLANKGCASSRIPWSSTRTFNYYLITDDILLDNFIKDIAKVHLHDNHVLN